ncbi:DNA-binding transcriptional regulator, XRE-family HTH domain [Tenacibaculum sp. MAR_2009_124]|uniref:helix-turn-helix domain-containing protein n=1 Tax=Tenacibaculum sp. MAR_2009_124 TaxID=1250059 RepID=UPI00089A80E9|nr:helix-turn-helix transcriptional regulator [Tenacibaculum sp. MAR_2009_124]SEC01703.1 DNA-binding transcriptional regulator, XRE-family HTH domain [Tenacibaculum sp. MAR_2009_124]
MTLGEHILILRKKNNLSQSALGKEIGTSGDIIGRYERNVMTPSIEVIIKLADVLNVSIDFLVGKTTLELNKKALKRIEEVSKLNQEEQDKIFMVIDALIRDFNAKKAYS